MQRCGHLRIIAAMRACCECETPTELSHAETIALYRSFEPETRSAICAWFCRPGRVSGLLPFLAVGASLRDLGDEVRVEPQPEGPPLWRTEARKSTASFFVDVVPIDLSDEELLEFRVSSRLVETLQSIPIDERVHLTVTDYRAIIEEDARRRIVERAHAWLAEQGRASGDALEGAGYALTMMERDKVRDHLAVIGPAFTFWIRKLAIDRQLEERVRLRRDIAAEHPYILAGVAPERVGLSRRCYSELLAGHPDEPGGASLPPIDRPPLFTTHPEISAAAWLWKSSRGIWEMKAIGNASAERPLPGEALDGPE